MDAQAGQERFVYASVAMVAMEAQCHIERSSQLDTLGLLLSLVTSLLEKLLSATVWLKYSIENEIKLCDILSLLEFNLCLGTAIL
jgi:hypothetical protein